MPKRDSIRTGERNLVIGLVNNMSKAASRTTERQFQRLLDRRLPPPGRAGEAAVPSGLCAIPIRTVRSPVRPSQIWRPCGESRVDGMIVTGSEPQADAITEEPMWPADGAARRLGE